MDDRIEDSEKEAMIDSLFEVTLLNERGKNEATVLRLSFTNLVTQLRESLMNSRELSLALTKLEESCFYAIKSLKNDARNLEAHEVEGTQK